MIRTKADAWTLTDLPWEMPVGPVVSVVTRHSDAFASQPSPVTDVTQAYV